MSGSQEHPSKSFHSAVESCTEGLFRRVEVPAKNARTGLDVISSRQKDLTERISVENEKFAQAKGEFNLSEAVQKTRFYHQKLTGLQKEMQVMSERSASMKVRAMKLLDAKQEEALRRENERIAELEREEQLVAKPAVKKEPKK